MFNDALGNLLQIKDYVEPYLLQDQLKEMFTFTGDYPQKILLTISDVVKDALPTVEPDKMYFYKGELPSLKSAVVGTFDAMATVHPNYLLVAATFVAAFFILYIKMQYPFWNQIPALHTYDWHRRFLYSEKPYIIRVLPKKTKYYESRLVKTERFCRLTPEKQTELTELLQNSYLPSDRVFYSIQLPDLAAQCAGSLVSVYNQLEEDIQLNEDASAFESKSRVRKIEGAVTSRPINVSISLGAGDARYIVLEPGFIMDYICFDRRASSSRKIRQLFHSHEYNQRLLTPDRNITVFKKEVELCEALVPLVKYTAFTFYLRHRIQPLRLPTNWQIVRIQKEHQSHLHDYMNRVASLKEPIGFRVSITAEIGDIITLLQTNQLFAYVLRGPDKEIGNRLDTVYAIYFFRNAHMKYEDLDAGDTIHFMAAFCNTNNAELYFQGFLWALRAVINDFPSRPKMLMMDDIGHLRAIVRKWTGTHDIVLRTPCAYYLCNYVVPRSTFREEDVNLLI